MTNLWITPSELGATYSESIYAEDACQMASNILWAMSGRKYSGTTTVTERYFTAIDAFRYQGSSAKQFFPHMVGGSVFNLPAEDWNDSAYQSDGTSSLSRIRLRGKPVTKVHLVRSGYDGHIIPEDAYYLAEHSTLIANKGTPWTPGNLEVTYTFGSQPPSAGRNAAKILAIEFIKLWQGDACALPDRVTSISRQGVSYTILDNQDFLENFRTGIYAIDLFLKVANPAKALAPSKVFSPDMPRARRAAPSRSVTITPSATYDVALSKSNSWTVSQVHTCSGSLASYVNYNNPAWSLELVNYSYSGSTSRTLDSTSAFFTEVDGVTYINLNFDYKNAYAAIGHTDPGTWVLYAREISTGATTELLTGNLQIIKVSRSDIPSSNADFGTPTRLVCPQGATFSKTLRWTSEGVPVPLSGYTAAMQVKTSYGATTALVTLTTANGGITLGATNGEILISISASATAAFPVGDYVYDLELTKTSTSTVTRLLAGTFAVTPEVTTV